MERVTNSKVLFHSIVNAITLDESKEEIESIVYTLLHGRAGIRREQILTGKEVGCLVDDFTEDITRINTSEPIQYILGAARFYGREFYVDRSVLIPRPETEGVVSAVLSHPAVATKPARVLDVGTGSGCIAITIALESPATSVTAIDVSAEALATAGRNSEKLGAKVNFMKHDMLTTELQGMWDVIVSNPPYVMTGEANGMKRNVTEFEPHLALFVPDTDPLLFYRTIARAGLSVLTARGVIIVEINERMGKETAALFSSFGYTPKVLNDLDGKDRVVLASRK